MIGFCDLKLEDVLKKMHDENLSYNDAVSKLDEEIIEAEHQRELKELYDNVNENDDTHSWFDDHDEPGDYDF